MTLHLYLGHGASGTAASMAPWVSALRQRGFTADALDLPRGKAERAVPVLQAAVPTEPTSVVGGHSFGGRVASLAAAEPGAPYAALVLLSYPLHRPGAPDTWRDRTAHWTSIRCPVLLLSGESDPFAKIGLLHEAVRSLPRAELVTYPRAGHGLGPVLDAAADRIAAFLGELAKP